MLIQVTFAEGHKKNQFRVDEVPGDLKSWRGKKKSLGDERLKCVGCRTKSKRGWIGFHHGHRHSVCYTNAKVLFWLLNVLQTCTWESWCVFYVLVFMSEREIGGRNSNNVVQQISKFHFFFFLSSFLFVFPFSPIDYSLIVDGNYTVIAMGVYYPHAPLYATTRFLSTPPSSFLLKITFADCFDTKEVVCNISPYFVHISLIGFKFLYCL